MEDEDENGQYFVDKVTGEFYFQSSNGDLEQLGYRSRFVGKEFRQEDGMDGAVRGNTPTGRTEDATEFSGNNEEGVA